MKQIASTILLFTITALAPITINAALINYSYEGTFDISQLGGSSSLSASVDFTLDTDIPSLPEWSCQNDTCRFSGYHPTWNISIDGLPSTSLSDSLTSISITNNDHNDVFKSTVMFSPISITSTHDLVGVGLWAYDTNGSMFHDFSIPTSIDAFGPESILTPGLIIKPTGDGITSRTYGGTLDSITITAVPVPPSLLLFISGAIVLIFKKNK